MQKKEHRFLWAFVSIVIAALSVWAVTSHAKSFSLKSFADFIVHGNHFWLGASILAVFLYIFCEAKAQSLVCNELGYKTSLLRGVEYSATDIYFCAITPSASGGQPAAGMLMNADGIPGATATAILLLNITMYAVSILILVPICFLLMPGFLFQLGVGARILVLVGYGIQIVFAVFLFLLLRSGKMLEGLCSGFFRFLGKLHILHDVDKRIESLHLKMDEYRLCTKMFAGNKRLLIHAFIWNTLERIMNIAIIPLVYLSSGGNPAMLPRLFILNTYVTIGSKFVPIPGSMVAADYLLLDGLSTMMPRDVAVNMELLGRSVSFYFCVFLCGLITLIAYLRRRHRKAKKAS